jgi:hypothetical protein
VVEEANMGIPQVLHGLDKVAQPDEIGPEFGERDSDANMHSALLIASEQLSWAGRRAGVGL